MKFSIFVPDQPHDRAEDGAGEAVERVAGREGGALVYLGRVRGQDRHAREANERAGTHRKSIYRHSFPYNRTLYHTDM